MIANLEIPNLERDVVLAPYTTYKIGGPADLFVAVKNKAELVRAITEARKHEVPYFILGTGANILIGDKGFRGLVIKNEANGLKVGGERVVVESGATIADLIRITTSLGLSGLEHYAGIPSSVGGALWQNLHFLSPDRTKTMFIESVLESAEILDENNEVLKVDKDFFQFGYDHSILHERNLVVIEATFQLEKKAVEEVEQQALANMAWRREKHPPLETLPSCGSVFKKIEGIGAGRLIEKAGLKGFRLGGIQVSEQHANFLVNTGGATAQDVLSLINLIKEKVKADSGYTLETEIGLVGEF